VHFQRNKLTFLEIGYKALARSLSDIAAMAAVPKWVLVSVIKPADMSDNDVLMLYDGMNGLLQRYDLEIVGGDLSRGSQLVLSVSVIGLCAKNKAIERSKAQMGDDIFVTGFLGFSIDQKHFSFDPRVNEGRWLAQNFELHAMIDLSDGLGKDLTHLAQGSQKSLEIFIDQIPIAHEKTQFDDGEDYELLLIGKPQHSDSCQKFLEEFKIPCTKIGRVCGVGEKVWLVHSAGEKSVLEDGGFSHF